MYRESIHKLCDFHKITGGTQDGLLFGLTTVWREDGTKLPITIRGVDSVTARDAYIYLDGAGGQYLNACVWFETLTGQSCIGNTWRPDTYELSESMIAALQQAAHRAVAESRA